MDDYEDLRDLFFDFLNNKEFEEAYNLCDQLLDFEDDFSIDYNVFMYYSDIKTANISLFDIHSNKSYEFSISITIDYDIERSISKNDYGYKEKEIPFYYLEDIDKYLELILEKFEFWNDIQRTINFSIENNCS